MSQCACFSSKILCVVNLNRKLHACQMAPPPPPPGTDKAGKCHAVARGEGGAVGAAGIDGCIITRKDLT